MFIEKSRYRDTIRVRISEQVFSESKWRRKVLCHIGTAKNDVELAVLLDQAQIKLDEMERGNQLMLPFEAEELTHRMELVGETLIEAEKILGSLFDRLGITLNPCAVSLFRQLVIARILLPASKRKTAVFLNQYFQTKLNEQKIYRFMDLLGGSKDVVTNTLRNYAIKSDPYSLSYVMYDVTTLYFETDNEDEDIGEISGLRKKGYSKDHREDLPQVVVGLAVNGSGMPLSYQLHSGNTYEGNTLISSVDQVMEDIAASSLTVVADAGMLSRTNLAELENRELGYIVGPRLKSLSKKQQDEILSLDFSESRVQEIAHDGRRLIVSFSTSRAQRSATSRRKTIEKLSKRIIANKAISKSPYLDFSLKERPQINQKAVEDAARWDGIKGYVTNNFLLSAEEVIKRYRDLYKVEQSFRMSKSDLKIRPAFHFRRSRIEAHVIICMVALSVMRMLEEEVKPLGVTLGEALKEIENTKAVKVKLGQKEFVISRPHSPTIKSLLARLKLVT